MHIGKQYLLRKSNKSYLCADIKADELETTLWFAVKSEYEDFLAQDSAEAFVMALLPYAMRTGESIICEGKISERFSHGLNEYLIPVLTSILKEKSHCMKIKAPLTNRKYPTAKGVGIGVSSTKAFQRVVKEVGKNTLYPVTHFCVSETGDGKFQENCEQAYKFASDSGAEVIVLESNFAEILDEPCMEVCSFRELAGALALQKLLQTYLLTSENALEKAEVNEGNAKSFDYITANFSDTETMRVYLAGYETEMETC